MDDKTLIEAVFLYITEGEYPNGCSGIRKRVIRKKASMFCVREGEMFYKKKKKRGVSFSFISTLVAILAS